MVFYSILPPSLPPSLVSHLKKTEHSFFRKLHGTKEVWEKNHRIVCDTCQSMTGIHGVEGAEEKISRIQNAIVNFNEM